MAACSAKSFRTSDGFERLGECPICFDVLNEPKSLSCGHSVCQPCANRMTRGQRKRIITCPVCRVKTNVPVGGLPTNYTLAELVGQIVAQRQSRCHKCTVCDKMNSSGDIRFCHSCNKVALGLSCALQHKDHKLQQLSDMIDNQREEWEEWKNNKMNKKLETMEGKTQIMHEIRVQSTLLCESVANKSSWLKQSEDDLQKRLNHFKEKLNNTKESDLNQNNGYMFDFKALEDELQKIGDTQSQFLEKGQDLVATVQSFEAKLNGLLTDDVLADYWRSYSPARRAAPVSISRNTRNAEHEHEGETSSRIARIRIGSRTVYIYWTCPRGSSK